MKVIDNLRKDHEAIERELLELETIRDAEVLNYINLAHTFKRLYELWNKHEELENNVFSLLEKDRIKVPVKKMLFEHKILRQHKEMMFRAISSGSEAKMREALDSNLSVILKELRKHMNSEDEVLFTISEEEFTDDELSELASYD